MKNVIRLPQIIYLAVVKRTFKIKKNVFHYSVIEGHGESIYFPYKKSLIFELIYSVWDSRIILHSTGKTIFKIGSVDPER